MAKYSEIPLENIQLYLDNIENMLEEVKRKQEEQSAAPSQSAGAGLEPLMDELSSIRTAIDEIRKDNALISASMNTVAEAIGTVPTEEERKKQHQEDLQYIIDHTKQKVTVDLESSTKAQLNNISSGISSFQAAVQTAGETVGKQINDKANKLSEPLDRIAGEFETRIGNAVREMADKATSSVTSSVIENWVWRFMALTSLIVWCLAWIYPKIKEIDFPNGAEGFFYGVVIIWGIIGSLYGIYRWGKWNGNSYF